MNTEHTGTDDFQGYEDVYEAHLFEYVLRHVSKDPSLEPSINNAISIQLFEDERYAQYYGKVQQLYAQGLFNYSFSYADYLSTSEAATYGERDSGFDLSETKNEESASDEASPKGRQVSMTTFLGAVASLVIAFSIALIFAQNDEGVKTLGNDANLSTYDISALSIGDLEIKHNSVLLKEEGDMKQCKMQLVFKSVTEDGFLARSKNLGKGDEDPFLEDLEVRFPDSERSAALIKELQDQLNNRQFPECIVQGIHIKPKQRLHSFSNLPVVLINDIVVLESVE